MEGRPSKVADSILRVCILIANKQKQLSLQKCKKAGLLGGFKKEYKDCEKRAQIKATQIAKSCLVKTIKDCSTERCRVMVKGYIAELDNRIKRLQVELSEGTQMDKLKLAEQKLERLLSEIETGESQRVDHEEILSEIFIQSSEIETMEMGTARDMQILRLSIIAELDASNLYEKLAALASDTRVRETLLDISQEEKVHVGEFESLLSEVDPEYDESIEEGEDEVEGMEEQASKSASLYAMKHLGSKAQASLASKQVAKAGSAVGKLASKVGGFFRK
jgi:rubrerythrin